MLPVSFSKMISVIDASVNASPCIKNLRCYLDEHLNFKKFVSKQYKTISLNLQHIKHIPYCWLVQQVVQSLVTSHLDCANPVLYELPKCTIKRQQFLQNLAAKLVLRWKSSYSCFKVVCHIRTHVWNESSTNIRRISDFNIIKSKFKSFYFINALK